MPFFVGKPLEEFCVIGMDGIVLEGFETLEKKLAALRTDSPGFEKRLRGVIRKVLGEVRSRLQQSAKEGLQMKSDPRHAYKSVRYAVYKKLLGGQVNILRPRKAGSQSSFEQQRPSRQGRGGNRRARTSRNLDVYEGKDRGFILRWLNAGTNDRNIKNFSVKEGRQVSQTNTHPNTGYRGKIVARNWFGPRSQQELNNAAGKIQEIIDRIINDEFV